MINYSSAYRFGRSQPCLRSTFSMMSYKYSIAFLWTLFLSTNSSHPLFTKNSEQYNITMTSPVLFILGAGPKIGTSVAQVFAAKGYKVALAARSLQDGLSVEGYLHLKLDLANTANIPAAFEKVNKELGIPSVVVYNGNSFPEENHYQSCYWHEPT